MRSDGSPRLFRIDVPAFDCFFSGTGDMFAALIVARFREAVFAAKTSTERGGLGPVLLQATTSWMSPDAVPATELPLASATVKVLASMHSVLEKTIQARNAELRAAAAVAQDEANLTDEERQKRQFLLRTKAAEVRLVRNVRYLQNPTVTFTAQEWAE